MLHLRQFHLQLALVRAGAAGENVENQPGTVEHPAFQTPFEIAFLAGRQIMIEDDQFGARSLGRGGSFIDLAAADIQPGIRTITAAAEHSHHFRTRGTGQLEEFGAISLEIGAGELQMHQYRFLQPGRVGGRCSI